MGGKLKMQKKMKKFTYIIMLAASAAAMSCNKESQPSRAIEDEITSGEQMTIQASTPIVVDADTKTYLSEGSITWAANDAINIFGDTSEKFTLASGQSTTSGTFTGNAVSGDLYGLYPYDAEATCTGGVITATVKDAQNANKNNIANNTNLAVGHYADGAMVFQNLCGLLKFEIKSDNVAEVVISGNNNEDLAGKVSISWSNGAPQYTVLEGSKTISIKTYNGAVMSKGVYYAMVLPQTFTKGITVTLKPYKWASDDVMRRSNQPADLVKTGSSALTIERSHIKPLGFIDKGLVWNFSNQVTCGGLRGSHTATGCYMDVSNGRTFSPIGSYAYCDQIDLAFVTNASNGLCPAGISQVGGLTNATNVGKFGSNYTTDDYVNNWTTKLSPKMAYVAADELSDADYDAITTVAQVKAIYDAKDQAGKTVQGYKYTVADEVITNANRTAAHKYFVIKTYSNTEGVGYGIFKILAVGGSTWYINFNYKHGFE